MSDASNGSDGRRLIQQRMSFGVLHQQHVQLQQPRQDPRREAVLYGPGDNAVAPPLTPSAVVPTATRLPFDSFSAGTLAFTKLK